MNKQTALIHVEFGLHEAFVASLPSECRIGGSVEALIRFFLENRDRLRIKKGSSRGCVEFIEEHR